MDSEDRLRRALGASAAPVRDPGFTLAVIRAAEVRRFRWEAARSILKAAGMAAAAAALVVPFLGWSVTHAEGLQSGILGAAGLLALVGTGRLMSARAASVLRR